jgi:Fic family protein
MTASLPEKIAAEKQARLPGGLYHKTQVSLAYNSSRIEGSRLTEAQTRLIFETRTIGFSDEPALPVDDIIETANHFAAFDFLLDTLRDPLDGGLLKNLHRILKTGTADSLNPPSAVGAYKKMPNEVGGTATARPEDVAREIDALNGTYAALGTVSFEDIVEHHWRLEKIHPFQDGNGRVGRLVLFRECLKNGLTPFVIDERHKTFYYRGLSEFGRVRGFLLDTCRSAQDTSRDWIAYFYPELEERKPS